MSNSKNEVNSFYGLVKRACSESWCMKMYCTTCGAHRFRKELTKIGLETILDQMMWLTDLEIDYILRVQGSPIGILEMEMVRQPQLWSRMSMNPPDVYVNWKRKTDKELQQKLERKQNNLQIQEEIKRNASEKRVSRRKHWEQQSKALEISRTRIINNFNLLSFEDKIATIAEDYEHLPNYYPYAIESITEDEMASLSMETLEKLTIRLASLTSSRWTRLGARVNQSLCTKRAKATPSDTSSSTT